MRSRPPDRAHVADEGPTPPGLPAPAPAPPVESVATAPPATPPAPTTADYHGLTAAEVADRQARGWTNATEPTTSRSVSAIIRANVLTRFNALLGALFVVTVATGALGDAIFGGILVVNIAIGVTQEYLAKRKLDRIALLNAPVSRVIRDGEVLTLRTDEIVQDDLVHVAAGDQVPADGLLVTSDGLEIDESNLTGESDPVARGFGDPVRSGTVVVAGSGRFRATAVGAAAYVHTIAAQARKFTRVRSEIQESVDRLLTYITWVIVVVTPLAVWSEWRVEGDDWSEVVLRTAGGLTGLVPEGLVLLASVAFLLAAVALARHDVLVQELPAVEGLARVDVLCTDKTGTLTTGRITFTTVEPTADLSSDQLRAALGAFADHVDINATLQAIGAAVPPPHGWTRTSTTPFSSARKWSAAAFDGRGSWLMGAPEMLLPDSHPLRGRVSEIAGRGDRVLVLLHSPSAVHGTVPADARPVGLVVLSEQVRPDAAETLTYLRAQGVRILVISGDHPDTVAAVARRAGLDFPDQAVVDARELVGDPASLVGAVRRAAVLGRVMPDQKRAMVRALQAEGHVVAMTGDGVNDALALKDSDIGIAMGNGAPATKAIAELVLLDGRFGHLPTVLAEGRRVIGNVERVANLFVTKNVMSLVAILTAALVAMPFPFLPRHLTLVSATTIGIPAFFLALGPNERRYRPGFLSRVLRFSVPCGLVAGAVVISSYLVTRWLFDAPTAGQCAITGSLAGAEACLEPSTGATIALLTTSLWVVVVLARPLQPWKCALIAACSLLSALAFVVPVANEFFEFDTSPELALVALGIGAVGAALVELVHRLQPVLADPEW